MLRPSSRTPANHPVSGFPLSLSRGRADHPWSAAWPGRDSTTCCPSGLQTREDAMVITSLPVERGRSTLPETPSRLAGGGKSIQPSIQPSMQSSIQSSVALSVLCHPSSVIDSAIYHFRCRVTAIRASAFQASAISLRPPAPGSSGLHMRFPNRLPLTANRCPPTPTESRHPPPPCPK